MCIVEIDEKGRITLPNELRKILKLGKVLLVNAGDHVILVPVPENPLQVLNGALNIGNPFNEIREEAERLLEKETC